MKKTASPKIASKAFVKSAIKKAENRDERKDEKMHEKRDSQQMVKLKKQAAARMAKKGKK